MASAPQTPPVSMGQAPGAPNSAQSPQTPDPTASNPQTQTPDQKLDQYGMTKRDRDNLLWLRRTYKEQRSQPRRIWVRDRLRIMEYLKGNQYYVIGPDGFSFQDPFATQGQGTQQGNDQDIYHYVTNIIQWFERVIVSTLGATVPSMRYQPANAQSDLGNRVAQESSRANAYIERLNDEKALLAQKISYLALTGSYFVYTRPVRDERLSGDRTEMVTDEAMEEREVAPNRYICPNCGTSVPLDQFAVESQMLCPKCGSPVSAADFFPSQKLPMPVVRQAKEVPQMQVRKSLYNGLHVDADFDADSETGDPLVKVRLLDLAVETDVGAMRAMFPEMWGEFESDGESSTASESETDRIARLQIINPSNTGNAWWTKNSGIMTQGQMPTYSRTWIQPEAYNRLPQRTDADKLRSLFPDGLMVSSWNDRFLAVRPANLTNEWTWCGTRRGFGLYPPAILGPAMDFQDRINDAANTESEYYDRMAVPGIAYDANAISGKGLNGKYGAVGSWFPVRVKPKDGRTLQSVLFQPQFHMDKGIADYSQRVLLLAQMITGITPQMWGGGQNHIDTATGQKQALDVATGIIWLYWSAIREESARTSKNAIRCLALNATEQVFDVIKGDDNRFKNQPIDLSSLKNEIDVYPEEEQGYPESRQQMADRLTKLLTDGANNPLLLEMLQPMKNRRIVARALLPQEMEIPEESGRLKVLEDISRIMEGQGPVPALNPLTGEPMMMPSVQPDKLVDDLKLTIQTVKEYVTDNYWELKEQSPAQFEDILAYLQLASQYDRENELMNAPPAPPGGPPGAPAAAA
jgi:hypothetical protein